MATELTHSREYARKCLDRHLMEMNITLVELNEYGVLGWFPTERHRLLYALAQDLGLTE